MPTKAANAAMAVKIAAQTARFICGILIVQNPL
jgi:hypothetical protein